MDNRTDGVPCCHSLDAYRGQGKANDSDEGSWKMHGDILIPKIKKDCLLEQNVLKSVIKEVIRIRESSRGLADCLRF